MKVLFTIDHLGPAGSQRQLVTLATGLKSRGHDVELFIYYPHLDHFRGIVEQAGIPIHLSRKQSRFDLRPPNRLHRILKSGQFDISASFLTTPNIYNIAAARGTGARTVVSERSALLSERVPTSIRLRFAVYRFSDHIVVNSRHHHESLCREFPWMTHKSSTILNGVDLTRFAPTDRSRALEETRHNTLLAVGSIHAGKNFRRLIEALRLYNDRYDEPIRVGWAGREPVKQADIAEYEAAKEDIRRDGLKDYWTWLGVRDDIPQLLNEHEAFIHPSLFEGLPNAVCEAMAAGTPALVSNVCDHPWFVGDNERGLLFDPLDPKDIATAIRRFMLMPPEERRRLGRNARAFAERYLAVDVYIGAFEELFNSLLKAR